MTDTDDGGGRMTGVELISGAENQVFDDISDVDRATGDVSIRKIYAAVTSADTNRYLDAGLAVFREPTDTNTSVLLTSTESFYDERADIQAYLENYLVRGSRFNAFLYDLQIAGARSITLFGPLAIEPPSINATLLLIEFTTTAKTTENYSQYVRVIRILNNEIVTLVDDDGSYQRRIIQLELSEALRYSFHGPTVARTDNLTALGWMYTTVVADAATYYGIQPLTLLAETGDYGVTVASIYGQLVPSTQTEMPVLDVNAVSERTFATPSAGASVSFTTADTFSANFTLYLGRALVPASLTITITGGTLVDDGGVLKSGTTSIGTVDYASGIVVFAADSPTYTGGKTVTFTPAAPVTRVSNTFGLPVTATTRYRTYVATLKPIPARGTLIVDYRSQGNWYRLQDTGNGILAGASVNYGAGTLNFDTGSVSLTLGAYPDIYSSILFAYGAGADARAVIETTAVPFWLVTGTTHITPGSASLAWDTFTLTDQSDGTMTGTGGSATLNYQTGLIAFTPTTLPAEETTLDFECSRPATQTYTETFTPTADGNGVISLTLGHSSIIETSLSLTFTAEANAADVPDATVLLTQDYTVYANGSGGWRNGFTGTVNASAGTLTLDTDVVLGYHTTPDYEYAARTVQVWNVGTSQWDTQVVVEQAMTSTTLVADVTGRLKVGSTVTVRYSTSSSPQAVALELELITLDAALRPATGGALVANSLRFSLGDRIYQDVGTRLVYAWNSATGAGTDAGSFDAATGNFVLEDWPAVTNSFVIQSRAERTAQTPATRALFRTANSPVAPESFTFTVAFFYTPEVELSGTADEYGVLSGSASVDGNTVYVYGRIDYQTGTVEAYFGRWVTASGHESDPWYKAEAVVAGNILMPYAVDLSTWLYNCVTYSSLPVDSDLIGVDATRLPADGRVPLFRPGELALTHHTDTHDENTLSPTQTIDMGRLRLYRVVIDDADDQRLPASFYSVNRETGIVTMAADLNLTGYTGPYTFSHTIADLAVIADADLSGAITFNKALSHDYPATESRLSGVWYAGTLQARVSNVFAQTTWTEVWSDERIGGEPLAQYNNIVYPIATSNIGAYPDRFLIKFTGSTTFQVIGENIGLIATGNTGENCAPLNPISAAAYFTIDYRGWGSGWATGNCLRFNLIGACAPVDLIRAIQPSPPSEEDIDTVELLFTGNVDA